MNMEADSPPLFLYRKEDNVTLTNTYSLNVDIKKRMTSIVPTFSQGDSAVLKFRVYDNGKLMDMSDYTHSEVMFRQPSGRTLTGDADLVNGEIVYTFTGLEMAEIGKLETILSVSSGSSTVSIQPFYCFIYDSMKSNNLEYIGILQELIKEVQGLELDVGSLLSDFNSFDYSPTTTYDFPNLVAYNGSTYIALKQVRGITPIDDKINYRIAAQRGDVGVFEALSNEIRQKSQAANLAYKESYATLTALQNAYPTGSTYNHVVLADGMIYTWSNNAWINTQILANGTGISSSSISREKLTSEVSMGIAESFNSESAANYSYAITDLYGRLSEFVLNLEGKVPDEVLQAWRTRMNIGDLINDIPDEILNQWKSDMEIFSNELVIEDEVNPETLWGIVDSNYRLSELVINQQGKVPDWVLTAWKNRMGVTVTGGNSGEIVAWGDSLTAQGGTSTSYIAEVGRLSGKTVHNNGVGGESSSTIAARQGGLVMMVNNITIPASASERVQVANYNNRLVDNTTGRTVTPLRQGTGGINPCYIKGVKGTLSVSQTSSTSEDYVLYFQREANGDSIVINRPTPIITDGSLKRRNDIMVIFIGQNGGFNNDNNELISQIRAMIDFNTATQKEYIVLGLTSGTATSRADLEKAMTLEFGRRYINLRAYLSTYGLSDLGLTPTATDIAAMTSGSVPPSMLTDTVHHTEGTRRLIGKLIYDRMVELEIL